MICARCGIDHDVADVFDGCFCRECAVVSGVVALAARLGLSVSEILSVAGRIDVEAPTRISDQRRAVGEALSIESFAERTQRLGAWPWEKRTRTLAEPEQVLGRLDKGADLPGSTGGRECPVCMRLFHRSREDRVTCSGHCRDIARRVRQHDPGAGAALLMLFDPPACAGCGEPLWAMRPEARFHGTMCRKRAHGATPRTDTAAA